MMRWLLLALLLPLLAGCLGGPRPHLIAHDMLMLRVSWEVPAAQAGVLAEMREHVAALDEAILTGDPRTVRTALLSLQPIYLDVAEQIDEPTPEQREFDQRARALWDELHREPRPSEELVESARMVLRLLLVSKGVAG